MLQRLRPSGRGLVAGLCLVGALLLNLPYAAPGCEDPRNALVALMAGTGVLLNAPSAWRVGRRFTAPWARRLAGALAALTWLLALGYVTTIALVFTHSPGFMQSRELQAIIRSADGGVTFHLYQWRFLDPVGDPELVLRRWPFEIGLVKGDRHHLDDFDRRTRDIHAFGHRLELDGDKARIDGQPAHIEYVGTQG